MVETAYKIGLGDTALYKLAGNSVTVNVVYEIAKKIMKLHKEFNEG